MDRCPSCERPFEKMQDFPLIYMVKFQRLEIPDGLVFPNADDIVFLGPEYKSKDRTPPTQVLNYFRDNPKGTKFEHEGWTWRKQPETKWSNCYYSREEVNIKDKLLSQLNPYLEKLEQRVSLEIKVIDVLPELRAVGITTDSSGAFIIPETKYALKLDEQAYGKRQQDDKQAQQDGLLFPDLETERCSRKVIISLLCGNKEKNGFNKPMANIAGFAYEGRIHR